MRRFLPSCVRLLAGAVLAAAGMACVRAEEPETLLAFLEAHFDGAAGVDGLDNAYDLKVAPDGAHLYVASMNDSAIAIFERDVESGSLAFLGRVKDGENGLEGLGGARSLAISPDGAFLYAVSMWGDSLVSFARDKQTGALSFIGRLSDGEGGVDGLDEPRSIAMSPDGENLYVAALADNALSIFSRNPATGAASFLGRLKQGEGGVAGLSQPHAARVSPDGASVYVALWGEDAISHLSRDPETGLLTYKAKLVDGVGGVDGLRGPRALELSPDGGQLYVASWNDDAIAIFGRDADTGDLAFRSMLVNGAGGVSGLDGPHSLASSLDGRYLYAASFFSDAVATFDRDLATGDLAFRQVLKNSDEGVEGLNGALTIAASPDGRFVYLTASSDKSLVAFERAPLVEPPAFVVQPVSRSVAQGGGVAFYALALGVDVAYQWFHDDEPMAGETLPVLTLANVAASLDGSTFHVVVSNGGGAVESGAASLTVLPPLVLNAPQDLTAQEISSKSARIAWTDASDNEAAFEIQRRAGNGAFATIATVFANQAQYDDESLAAATTYIYRVRARRDDEASRWSNDAVVESFAEAPTAPADLFVAESTYNKVRLAWRDRSAVEDGFRIQRRRDEEDSTWETIATAEKNATEYTDRSVAPDEVYAYRAQAYNASGSSGFTASVVAITSSIPVESISPASRALSSDAASGLAVSVVSQKSWEAISDVPWLIVTSPANGRGVGNQSVAYAAQKNESTSPRVGRIVIGGIEHLVTQAESEPFLRVLPTRVDAAAAGQIAHVSIESNIAWIASEESDWLEILSGESGSGNGAVSLRVLPNDGLAARAATLLINDRALEVAQAGRAPYLDLDIAQASYPAEGGQGSVSISSNIAWIATSNASWLTILGGSAGSGAGVVAFSIEENKTWEARATTIQIGGKTVSVEQAPADKVLSDVPAPTFIAADVSGGLGVALMWHDNSDTEIAFALSRARAGSEAFAEIARLDADAVSYLDRGAERGAAYIYRIEAIDEAGYSLPDSIETETLPNGGFAQVVTRAPIGVGEALGMVRFSYVGNGYVERRAQGFGRDLGSMRLPDDFARGRLRVGGPMAGSIDGLVSSRDIGSEFDMRALAYPANPHAGFSLDDNGLWHGVAVDSAGGAWIRGVGARVSVGGQQGPALVAFEIEGDLTLPVLVRGIGASLVSQRMTDFLDDPRIELYRFEEFGAPSLVASNDDWESWDLDTPVSLRAAMETVAAKALESGSRESALLVMLPPGRYGAVLRAPAGESGIALLAVHDAR